MHHIAIKISGVPYSAAKAGGDNNAPKRWRKTIIEQTSTLPQITEACILTATFLLPSTKYPRNLPYGSDLDNLLNLLFNALNETVFSQTKGGDSCVISLNAAKTQVTSDEEAGVILEILPVSIRPS